MGRFIFYVDVGQAPPVRAKKILDSVKEDANACGFFDAEDRVLYLATREGNHRVEYIPQEHERTDAGQ